MRAQHISKFFISLVLVVVLSFSSFAQDSIKVANDSVVFPDRYGLRVGVDAAKLIRTAVDDTYSGFEVVGDFRLSKKWYVAAEMGNEKKTTEEDFLNNTTKGSYIKAGLDYNSFENFLGLENMIYFGFRAGGSTFSQTLDNFETNNRNRYFDPQFISEAAIEFNDLTAFWAEFQFGIKAEVFNNLYFGLNLQLKLLVAEDEPENFQNLYIPGYNKTFDSGSFGFGYGYTISYFIPLFKN